MSGAPSTAWTCGHCGRAVPGRVTTCYCGRERPAPSAEPSTRFTERRAPASFSMLRVSITSVALAALACTVWYYAARDLADPNPGRALAHARDDSRPVIRASSKDPDAAVPASDDVVQRALRALVQVETRDSRATGFYIAPDLIATTRHAMGKDSSATITMRDGRQMNAVMVLSAYRQDFAVLRVETTPLFEQALPVRKANDVRNGDAVFRLSWPNVVTTGFIRSVRHHDQFIIDLIETTLVTQPADEGAPLLNRLGQVVGVVTAKHIGSPGSGFAVGLN